MATRHGPHTMGTLFAVGGIFGSSFLLVKLLVSEMSPAQITAWRLLFGSAAVLAVLTVRGGMRIPTGSTAAKAAILATLDSIIPNTLVAWAQIRMDSGIAALLMSSMPLFTVFIALGLPGSERLTLTKTYGLALGIAGVTLVVGADAGKVGSGAPVAHVAVLLASISNAVAVVFARSVLAREDPLQLSGVKLLIGAAIAFVVAALFEGGNSVPRISVQAWPLLIALGLFANGLGRTMYLSLIASAGSLRASLVAYIVPAVGVLLGWLVLGEQLGPAGVAGLAMVALGVVLVAHGSQLMAVVLRFAAIAQLQRLAFARLGTRRA